MKYKTSIYVMWTLALLSAFGAWYIGTEGHPQASAVLIVVAFMLWWFPMMLPAHEKYADDMVGRRDKGV